MFERIEFAVTHDPHFEDRGYPYRGRPDHQAHSYLWTSGQAKGKLERIAPAGKWLAVAGPGEKVRRSGWQTRRKAEGRASISSRTCSNCRSGRACAQSTGGHPGDAFILGIAEELGTTTSRTRYASSREGDGAGWPARTRARRLRNTPAPGGPRDGDHVPQLIQKPSQRTCDPRQSIG